LRGRKRLLGQGLVWAAVFGSLYLTSFYSYQLFHTLAEVFRVAVAVAIFMLIWNFRRSLDNGYLVFVGVAYIFVGVLDILHLIASQGMAVFSAQGTGLQSQLWIAARFLESLSLLGASFFVGRKPKLETVLSGYAIVTGLLLASILSWRVFPASFTGAGGPTPFRRFSEYAVSLTLLAALGRLLQKREQFDGTVLRFLATSIGFTFLSELSFAFYPDTQGLPYRFGHFLKIIAFYYIYKAIVETGTAKPLAVLFRNLQRSEAALRRERDFSDAVLTTQDVMVAVLDREARIVRVNKAAEELTGYAFDDMRDRRPWDFVASAQAGELRAFFEESLSRQLPVHREGSLVTRDGRLLWVLWSCSFLAGETGEAEYAIVSGVDITERKQAEEALQIAYTELDARIRERTADLARANELLRVENEERRRVEDALRQSETKYRTVADNTYGWEWWREPEGDFIYVSPSCLRITQHAAEEYIGDPDLLLRIVHPDDRTMFVRHLAEVEEKSSPGEIEFRILRPDRSIRWLAHVCQPVFDEHGRHLGRRGSNRDITERRRAEEALRESERQLRHLSSKLLTAQETERRRISRELHDELGGALAVLKLRTSSVEKKLEKGQQSLREECRQNLQYIDQIIESVSRLAKDLSPSILEDIGLTPALRWLIENFSKNYDVQVAADIADIGRLLPKESQILIYRIFQEALNNIGKHAQAKNISIHISRDEDRILCFVEDDGRGFNVLQAAARKASERGLGLAAMDERARMLGGSLTVRSEEGRGTRISLSVPVGRGEGTP
jgi:PAS domain S-box-containing protein